MKKNITLSTVLNFLSETFIYRVSMYVHNKDSFYEVTSFLSGYFLCIYKLENLEVEYLFQEWLQIKLKKQFNLHWSAYIYRALAKKNDALALDMLFELFKEFIKEINEEERVSKLE